jgi:lipoprotein-anchoring transpeptidase ErfK/SrfK
VNSLKSTCVVLVLAGVLYGVYVTLNGPIPAPKSHEHPHAEVQPPSIDFGPASQAPSLPNVGTTSQLPTLSPTIPTGSPANTAPPSANMTATFNAPESPSAAPAFEPIVETPAPQQPATPAANPPEATSAYTLPGTNTSPASPSAAELSPKLEATKLKWAWPKVEQHVKDGKFRDALAELSPFANNPHLTPEDRAAVLRWLDALAAKVIYGPEHYLSEAYRVTSNSQTLYEVAAAHKVPIQLLQNINSAVVKDPSVLLAGSELKVIPGPFRAELSLAAGELTLFVGPLYAGRFAFTVGEERPAAGTYHVQQKDLARTYIGRDGRQIAAGDFSNPYGNVWIDLGREVSLHGSATNPGPGPALGCLSFSPQDAADLYAILSKDSEVVIKP